MTFLCIKKVSRYPSKDKTRANARKDEKVYKYVYELEASRSKRTQKIKHKIIGRIGPLQEVKLVSDTYFSVLDAATLSKDEFIKHALRNNLRGYGFKQTNKDVFLNNDTIVDLNKLRVYKQGKNNIVLNIHDGYLCTKTLEELFDFELIEAYQLPELVKKVRNIGLLPLTVKAESLEAPGNKGTSVFDLIHAMEKALGEEPDELQTKTKLLIERHRTYLALLIKKYPKYRPPEKMESEAEPEELSMEEFSKKFGW